MKVLVTTLLLSFIAVAQQSTTAAPPGDKMIERFSLRSKQVLFLTRLKTGERGAPSLSVDDLIVSVIVEDQGKFLEAMSGPQSGSPQMVLPAHKAFLDSATADNLLQKIEALQEHAPPKPMNVDMTVSDELQRVFQDATKLADESHRQEVEPLHLLAAAAADESANGAELLREAGITKAAVMKAFHGEK